MDPFCVYLFLYSLVCSLQYCDHLLSCVRSFLVFLSRSHIVSRVRVVHDCIDFSTGRNVMNGYTKPQALNMSARDCHVTQSKTTSCFVNSIAEGKERPSCQKLRRLHPKSASTLTDTSLEMIY